MVIHSSFKIHTTHKKVTGVALTHSLLKGDQFRGFLFLKEISKENSNLMGKVIVIRKNIFRIFFLEDYLIQMVSAATSQMVQPLSPIFDNSFEHFHW